MSTQNGRRQVGHGVGGGNASIDNVAFSPGGWAGWIDDDHAFFANGADGWVTAIYELPTGKITRAITDPEDPQFGAGMNTGYAGGGVWAGWLGSNNEQRGLYTSYGLHLKDAGLIGVGPTGELGYKPSYQSYGPTVVRERDGSEWQLTPGSAYDLQLLGERRACWHEGNVIQVTPNMPRPQQLGSAYLPLAHLINGRWWISYFSTIAGIILHPFDDNKRGYVIVPPGVDTWHGARAFGDEVQFALFKTEAEQNGWLVKKTINVTTDPMVDLVPPPPPLVLPPMNRPIWFGWFEFDQSMGMASPGNSALLVRNYQGVQPTPVIVSDETASVVQGEILGHFISGTSVEQIEGQAKNTIHRPIAYWDSRRWPRYPSLPKGSWLCIQAYCKKDETPEQFEADMRSVLNTVPKGLPVVLVCQQYTSNANQIGYVDPTSPTPHDSTGIKKIAPVFVRLANDYKFVVDIKNFSGYGRRGGLQDHPDLVQPWQDWSVKFSPPSIVPYPPPPDPPDPPDPPKPKPPFFHHKGVSMATEIDGKVVVLRGPKGMLMRPDKPGTGIWKDADPKGQWRGSIFDVADSNDDRVHYKAKKLPNGMYSFFNVQEQCYAGADAGQYSPDLLQQFYHLWTGAPDDRVGGLEMWRVYDGNNNGAIEAQTEQETDDKHPSGPGKKFSAYPLWPEVVG